MKPEWSLQRAAKASKMPLCVSIAPRSPASTAASGATVNVCLAVRSASSRSSADRSSFGSSASSLGPRSRANFCQTSSTVLEVGRRQPESKPGFC